MGLSERVPLSDAGEFAAPVEDKSRCAAAGRSEWDRRNGD